MESKAIDRANALSHALRLEVMAVLFRGAASAAEIAQELDAPSCKRIQQIDTEDGERLRSTGEQPIRASPVLMLFEAAPMDSTESADGDG